jgi:general secretion pathway protein D
MRGIPGLSDIPLLGKLFAANESETQQTDIVLMLTPRIIRVLDLTEDDLRPFAVGRGSGTGTSPVMELSPVPATPLPRQAPQGYEGLEPFVPQQPQSPTQPSPTRPPTGPPTGPPPAR